jgi:NADH dehydrogenase
VHTNTLVTALDERGVNTSNMHFAARTVLWAAGVAASPLARSLGVPLDRAGRVQVQPNLTIPGHGEVFVIGDLAAAISHGRPVPGVAPAAIQGGRHAARCIRQRLAGQPSAPFHCRHRGALATIGRAAALTDFGWRKLTGLLSWAWAYLTFQRGARLITGAPEQLLPRMPGPDRQQDNPGAALVAPHAPCRMRPASTPRPKRYAQITKIAHENTSC